MKTRASSNEVDYYLHGGEQDRPTIEAICRDWLDMGDRLAAAERVIQAARIVAVNLANDSRAWRPEQLVDALAAYDDATTGSAE